MHRGAAAAATHSWQQACLQQASALMTGNQRLNHLDQLRMPHRLGAMQVETRSHRIRLVLSAAECRQRDGAGSGGDGHRRTACCHSLTTGIDSRPPTTRPRLQLSTDWHREPATLGRPRTAASSVPGRTGWLRPHSLPERHAAGTAITGHCAPCPSRDHRTARHRRRRRSLHEKR